MSNKIVFSNKIVSQGYMTQRVWEELEQSSRETRIAFEAECPVCAAEIPPTDTQKLRCLRCDAPVAVYQHRHRSRTADTRRIFVEVSGHSREVLRVDLRCLSCEQPLKTNETCENTCEIQTYLVRETKRSPLESTAT